MKLDQLLMPALIGCFVSGLIGVLLAGMSDRREERAFWLGFFLGPIGWILAACSGPLKSDDDAAKAAAKEAARPKETVLQALTRQYREAGDSEELALYRAKKALSKEDATCGACGHTAPENHFGKHPRGGLTCPNCGVRNETG